MCLSRAMKITPTDSIVCYKVMTMNECPEGLHSLFFSEKTWKLGRTASIKNRATPVIKQGSLWNDRTEFTPPLIQDGAYHTYMEKYDAIAEASQYLSNRIVVVECLIPKNSKYVYTGMCPSNGTLVAGYASQKLKPIKIIHPYKES